MSRLLKTRNNVITQTYQQHCDKVKKGLGVVKGTDIIGAPCDCDYILAHSSGTVLKIVNYIKGHELDKDGTSYGNYVAILHDDNYVTLYAHLASVSKLTVGSKIAKGTVLGYMGNTGNVVLANNNPDSGAHLHFEVRKYQKKPDAATMNILSNFEFINSQDYLEKDLPGATPTPTPTKKTIYRVQVGAYSVKSNADNQLKKVKKAGFTDAFITNEDGMYKVQVGAYEDIKNAQKQLDKVKKVGFDAYIKTVTV